MRKEWKKGRAPGLAVSKVSSSAVPMSIPCMLRSSGGRPPSNGVEERALAIDSALRGRLDRECSWTRGVLVVAVAIGEYVQVVGIRGDGSTVPRSLRRRGAWKETKNGQQLRAFGARWHGY
jgi:hypothetical protein